MDALRDIDPVETKEWRDALDPVLAFEGADRAQFLLENLADEARRQGAPVRSYRPIRPTSIPSGPTRKSVTRAIARSSTASAP